MARRSPGVLAWLFALTLASCTPTPDAAPETSAPIGLNSSLPILWSESADVTTHLAPAESHWALAVLGKHGPGKKRDVRGLDSLAGPRGVASLGPIGLLVLAQPYPLSPDDNVALDDWVRGGGRVLLFADPMLTAHSIYPLGDRRRPQDVALLSPILSRWGVELRFDEAQSSAPRSGKIGDVTIPVRLSGTFAPVPGAGGCVIEAEALVATCTVGKGRVVAVADAAMLDRNPAESAEFRARALAYLLGRLTP
ncbi:MAG TPA: DUF4350 domain-containing protein [Novosphingobium sp.]|nr:DUF4350 domain-containing protein [Novosphingobium sp.]